MALQTETGGIEPRITSSGEFLGAMDKAARFLFNRGFYSALTRQPKWLSEYMMQAASEGSEVCIDIPPVRGLVRIPWISVVVHPVAGDQEFAVSMRVNKWLRRFLSVTSRLQGNGSVPAEITTTGDPEQVRRLLGTAAQVRVLVSFVIALFNLSRQLAVGLLLSITQVFRSTLRSVPPLLAAIAIIFVTGDAWRIFGTEYGWRYWTVMGFFVVVSWYFVLASRQGESLDSVLGQAVSSWEAWLSEDRRRRVKDTGPGTRLRSMGFRPDGGHPERPISRVLTRSDVTALRVAVTSLALFQVVTMGIWIAGALILVGCLRLSEGATASLLGTGFRVHVLWHVHGSIVITRELVLVSTSLGAFASLYFSAVGLADSGAHKSFFDLNARVVRRLAVTLLLYRNAESWVLAEINRARQPPAVASPAGPSPSAPRQQRDAAAASLGLRAPDGTAS